MASHGLIDAGRLRRRYRRLLGPVDKRDSQIIGAVIQGFLLEGGRLESRGFVGRGVGRDRALAAVGEGALVAPGRG